MSPQGMGIAGIGAVTGYGWGREMLWDGLLEAKPAAALVEGYGVEEDETAWVARIPDGGDPEDGPSRFARAMRAAAREAITDAGRRGWLPGRRVGLLHATVQGEVDLWRDFYVEHGGRQSVRGYLAMMPSTPMSLLAQEYGFHGPSMVVSAMCASGNAGLITAKSWLDGGLVDDVVFVSTDVSATCENLLHFERLGVAVTDAEPLDACRPFQEGSRGYIMGEASVAFVLSNRDTNVYTRVVGGAMSHDAHHVTSIEPNLTQVRECFRDALADARVPADALGYLNAHGPGTRQCDRAEATLLGEFFPATARVYSVKPLAGHCQAAAAGVEVAAAALGYERGLIPAPPRVAPGHPQLLDGPTPLADGLTVKSSLGMGGHNAVVVLAPPA
ncbi:beta-ketoacyl synthase N-terminal-like domain-containing protein [Amycolatopsis nigrescens]|uniref:beta-ketoacyl synthase N-terminal-like domain-containing protein n=1 Tax=Amycolatopsis nigrescens TaxID=381445 RepID=UPI0004766D36|nr:beta-ketoacyl synthase N-terminal-like domain-containing protein [Amycolatopsis nigrescens]